MIEGGHVTLYRTNISDNTATNGGGVAVKDTGSILACMKGTQWLKNVAGKSGGGLYSEDARTSVYSNQFMSNRAGEYGGTHFASFPSPLPPPIFFPSN